MQFQELNGDKRIRVAIVDHAPMRSQLLASAVQRDHRIEVVGSVTSSGDLSDVINNFDVDVVIVHAVLDGNAANGFEVIREIRRANPSVCGVILLNSPNKCDVVEAFRAGAKGVFAGTSVEDLCKCIRCVHAGEIWASHADLKFALDALAATPSMRTVNAKSMKLLSKRETEVVWALAEGLTNREIAERLGLSGHTVKNHLFRIFDKIGVSNRMELLFLILSEHQDMPRQSLNTHVLQAPPKSFGKVTTRKAS
ncbi:MAG TPA: response regulator transcription factor [Candidatus Sulfotelmatobacter sp.]|nr:response regulator transcription factor [Candidatus Sulfotelmatobacter sp.]